MGRLLDIPQPKDHSGMDLRPILQVILCDYSLSPDGDHGQAHWARVLENGLRLAPKTGANLQVVTLFAVLHDARRVNEFTDPEHGLRGAQLAAQLRGDLFELADHEFALLYRACAGHTNERTHPDLTIQTCWDSDRLDLGRVGIKPHPSRLCTEFAKRPETIEWAHERSTSGYVPELIANDWRLEL